MKGLEYDPVLFQDGYVHYAPFPPRLFRTKKRWISIYYTPWEHRYKKAYYLVFCGKCRKYLGAYGPDILSRLNRDREDILKYLAVNIGKCPYCGFHKTGGYNDYLNIVAASEREVKENAKRSGGKRGA